jgi:pre-mRNA-splicing helicase BRR2
MAEDLARRQQYEYRQVKSLPSYNNNIINIVQNSNLVLQVDYNLVDRRGRDEATGEVMPLTKDLLTGVKMGDKYRRTAVPDEKRSKR